MARHLLFYSLCIGLLCGYLESVEGANTTESNELISFPNMEKPCTCSGLTCNCCQTIIINPLKKQKSACLQFTLKILPLRLDVKISMNSKVIADFSIDPKNPPQYCIPVPIVPNVAACVKLHDMKLIGLTAMQVCSTFYVNFQTDQVFTYKFPCLKLSGSGIDMAKK